MILKAGSTGVLVPLFIQDSTSTTGAGLAALVYNSGSLTAYYHRESAASPTAITLATMTLGTWATGGFVKVDDTNMPGHYQLALPNAAVAAGAKYVDVQLKGAANMVAVQVRIDLVAYDAQDATALGLSDITALFGFITHTDLAVAGAAGSITLSAAASGSNDRYTGQSIIITGGAGAGQARGIYGYVGSTKVASVSPNWATNPSGTSTYIIVGVPIAKLDTALSVIAASVTGNVGGDLVGDIQKKVLGGGASTITGTGAQVDLSAAGLLAVNAGLLGLNSSLYKAPGTIGGFINHIGGATATGTGPNTDGKTFKIYRGASYYAADNRGFVINEPTDPVHYWADITGATIHMKVQVSTGWVDLGAVTLVNAGTIGAQSMIGEATGTQTNLLDLDYPNYHFEGTLANTHPVVLVDWQAIVLDSPL